MTAAPAEWIESLAGLPPGDAGDAEFFSARANLRNPATVELIH